MKYKITVYEATGWVRHEETTDYKKVAELKNGAHERAIKCLPFTQYEDSLTHLIYYYELATSDENVVEVTVREEICGVNDDDFYGFVDYWKPRYVGAIHRK